MKVKADNKLGKWGPRRPKRLRKPVIVGDLKSSPCTQFQATEVAEDDMVR